MGFDEKPLRLEEVVSYGKNHSVKISEIVLNNVINKNSASCLWLAPTVIKNARHNLC